jgi:ParB/RepB/Spo0J family partition protein
MTNVVPLPDRKPRQSSVQLIALDLIDNNPFRDLVNHPLREDRIETLIASIDSTGYWEGQLARPSPTRPGRFEIPFGHARLAAARRCGVQEAEFIVRALDDDAMIRAMADENVSQFGRDEYKTYREAVVAAVQRIMEIAMFGGDRAEDFFSTLQRSPDEAENITRSIADIRAGGCPGRELVGAYFKRTLSLPAIQIALKEFHASGALAAWHAAHNPGAGKADPATLDTTALSLFEKTYHVKVFSECCEELRIAPEQQRDLAQYVLDTLREPVAHGLHPRGKDFARIGTPPDERLTGVNIRRVMLKAVARSADTEEERSKREAEASVLSIERSLSEMRIGLQRAHNAAISLVKVAEALGGVGIDMTMTATLHLADCREAHAGIERCLRRAMKAGLNVKIQREDRS